MIRITWHWLRERYYRAALQHLSAFDPGNPDLLKVIMRHTESLRVLEGWE